MVDELCRGLVTPDLEIQDCVLFLHASHKGILGQIIRTGAELFVCTLYLLIERLNIGGKQIMKSESVTLL